MRIYIVALLAVLILVFSGCSGHISGVSSGSIGPGSLPALVTWEVKAVELDVEVASPAADAIAAELLALLDLDAIRASDDD